MLSDTTPFECCQQVFENYFRFIITFCSRNESGDCSCCSDIGFLPSETNYTGGIDLRARKVLKRACFKSLFFDSSAALFRLRRKKKKTARQHNHAYRTYVPKIRDGWYGTGRILSLSCVCSLAAGVVGLLFPLCDDLAGVTVFCAIAFGYVQTPAPGTPADRTAVIKLRFQHTTVGILHQHVPEIGAAYRAG